MSRALTKTVVWWEPLTNGGSSGILDMRNVQPTFWNIKKKKRENFSKVLSCLSITKETKFFSIKR